jgi:hypothetical protein
MRIANDVLRFALELSALAALGYWGFADRSGPVQWVLGIGAPVLAAVVWGRFVAPKASHPVADPLRLVLELAVFGGGVLGLAVAGAERLALALGVLVALHLALTFPLRQRRVTRQ